MMLLLRALVILGAVLAVISCGSCANPLAVGPRDAVLLGAGESICGATPMGSWESVPTAGGAITDIRTGECR
jgi:uncharacterized membrane protein YadS